jgi:hypothetical protein
MSSSVLYMSMSLDGFIAGPDDDAGQGLGSGGERLHDWLGDGGNGVSGRRGRAVRSSTSCDHHGVPIFVPTRGKPPAPVSDLVNYVTDELEIHLIPVLLGAGRPLFGDLAEHAELELTRVVDAPGVTHLHFRVKE